MPANPISRPWRRLLRFRVRGLLVFVLVIGVWLGWIVRSARVQHDAVAAIAKAHCWVIYDWGVKNGDFTGDQPSVPSWLVNAIGRDYFGNVAVIFMQKGSDDELTHVGRLCQLRYLLVSSSKVTDSGLTHLEGLTNLLRLELDSAQITDLGLAYLEGLTKLSTLDLTGTQVTDAGLAHLSKLTRLSKLSLRQTQITDTGLVHLRGLTSLSRLDLNGTRVSQSGVTELRKSLPNTVISL